MPAGRDTDWTHIRVIGDKAAASQYVSFSRKLLGFVKADAAHNGLTTHQVTKRLADGALVIAEIHGKQPIITIVPPNPIARSLKRMEDRFVVFARRGGLWDGIDPDHPEQWLDAPGVSRKVEDGWLTRYFDSEIEGYTESDGIYSVIESVPAFPLGTRRAGNIDHRSKDGYRVSWYGPTSRVALDAHINPGVVWLDKVFMHGQVLLTHPLGYGIFGAGFHAGSLFTVEGEVAALPVPYPAPESMTGYQNPPLSVATGTQLHVCRYPCSASMTPNRRRAFAADVEAREVLLTLGWDGKEQYPWAFNPDCTEVSGMSTSEPGDYQFASHMYLAWRKSYQPTVGPIETGFRFADADNQFSGPEALFPASRDIRYTVTISEDETGYIASAETNEASLPAESLGSAVVARDYDEDGNRIDLLVERDTMPAADGAPTQHGILFLRLGEQRWPVLSQNGPRIRDNGPAAYCRRTLLHADLPNKTLVFAVRNYTYTHYDTYPGGFFDVDVESRENRIEVWRRGVQLADVLVSTTEGADDTGHLSWPWKLLDDFGFKTIPHCLLTVPLAPSFALYGYAMALETTFPLDEPQSGVPGSGYFFGALGANATYFYSAWPGDFNFGWWQNPLGVPTPEQVIDYPDLQAQDVDLNVRYIPLWCATLGDHTRLSGPSYLYDVPATAFVWSDAGQPSTATLTGVAGTSQRYHPLWRLGRFDLVQGDSP